jgi:hypothetical protein
MSDRGGKRRRTEDAAELTVNEAHETAGEVTALAAKIAGLSRAQESLQALLDHFLDSKERASLRGGSDGEDVEYDEGDPRRVYECAPLPTERQESDGAQAQPIEQTEAAEC